MAERVAVRQDARLHLQIWGLDPPEPESDRLVRIERLESLTPYGMLLASLGSCTTVVLHTYAQNHAIPLEAAQIELRYERNFGEDCENCEEIEDYQEQIVVSAHFGGALEKEQLERLDKVSRLCSIHKMLEEGIRIEAEPASAQG